MLSKHFQRQYILKLILFNLIFTAHNGLMTLIPPAGPAPIEPDLVRSSITCFLISSREFHTSYGKRVHPSLRAAPARQITITEFLNNNICTTNLFCTHLTHQLKILPCCLFRLSFYVKPRAEGKKINLLLQTILFLTHRIYEMRLVGFSTLPD